MRKSCMTLQPNKIIIFSDRRGILLRRLLVCPAWVQSNGCKSRTRPDSGKCIAQGKGVHREVESEGSRRQTSGLTNRNHIRQQLRVRLQIKPKPNNYPELIAVNVADGWGERLRSYPGRSYRWVETE